jgi:hypothetical protein
MEHKLRSGIIREFQKPMAPTLRPYVEEAMRLLDRINPGCSWITNDTFRKVQMVAAALAEHRLSKAPSQADITPEGFIRSAEQFKRIRGELLALREEVFARKSPPFRSLDSALTYLKKQKRNAGAIVSHAILELCGQYFLFSKDSPLSLLAGETRRFEEESCFLQSSLVKFVMLGIEPIAPAYRIERKMSLPRLSSKGRPIKITPEILDSFPHHHIDIRLYRMLTDREILALIKRLNRKIRPARKRLSNKALRLYEFMREYGPPPRTGKMKFWEDAYCKWRKQYSEGDIHSAAGIRVAWNRLTRFVERI